MAHVCIGERVSVAANEETYVMICTQLKLALDTYGRRSSALWCAGGGMDSLYREL